ncbi:hypothetical protein TNIN_304411 [Trichonephila inaurata madagascariensis]|uniref:Uncharacterized protein n=1 Tax=Trichonephila inaurata madagascariensis TaxID=2747483 RepID=A0A8X6WLJ1_9ARAC|nr:hypothetical protein TNIN_304411 [Trichonephila inaurata madagascariensis]
MQFPSAKIFPENASEGDKLLAARARRKAQVGKVKARQEFRSVCQDDNFTCIWVTSLKSHFYRRLSRLHIPTRQNVTSLYPMPHSCFFLFALDHFLSFSL